MVFIANKANRYRDKAEECRALAATLVADHREHYLDLARMWDVLAADADVRTDFLDRNRITTDVVSTSWS